MQTREIGVRRVNITAKHSYDTHDEAKNALANVGELDVIDEFNVNSETDDEIQIMLGDDPNVAEYWAVFYITKDNKLMVELEFIGTQSDLFTTLLDEVLEEVGSMIVVNHDTETRVNTTFDSFVGLPIAQETNETVTGIQLMEEEHEYFFSAVDNEETAVVASRIENKTVTESMEEYYTEQIDVIGDFIAGYVP